MENKWLSRGIQALLAMLVIVALASWFGSIFGNTVNNGASKVNSAFGGK